MNFSAIDSKRGDSIFGAGFDSKALEMQELSLQAGEAGGARIPASSSSSSSSSSRPATALARSADRAKYLGAVENLIKNHTHLPEELNKMVLDYLACKEDIRELVDVARQALQELWEDCVADARGEPHGQEIYASIELVKKILAHAEHTPDMDAVVQRAFASQPSLLQVPAMGLRYNRSAHGRSEEVRNAEESSRLELALRYYDQKSKISPRALAALDVLVPAWRDGVSASARAASPQAQEPPAQEPPAQEPREGARAGGAERPPEVGGLRVDRRDYELAELDERLRWQTNVNTRFKKLFVAGLIVFGVPVEEVARQSRPNYAVAAAVFPFVALATCCLVILASRNRIAEIRDRAAQLRPDDGAPPDAGHLV